LYELQAALPPVKPDSSNKYRVGSVNKRPPRLNKLGDREPVPHRFDPEVESSPQTELEMTPGFDLVIEPTFQTMPTELPTPEDIGEPVEATSEF